ncbi:hypothetical protein FI667_g12472, partial [Globisporangium splendens]
MRAVGRYRLQQDPRPRSTPQSPIASACNEYVAVLSTVGDGVVVVAVVEVSNVVVNGEGDDVDVGEDDEDEALALQWKPKYAAASVLAQITLVSTSVVPVAHTCGHASAQANGTTAQSFIVGNVWLVDAPMEFKSAKTISIGMVSGSLIDVKWVNVAGNHDYGGAMFICGKWDNQFVECTSKADLLKQLDEKFTRQRGYKSPYNDRWQMPARCYVETIKEADTGVTVDIFNVDTNAATVHGGEQICCQCYGYKTKYGGDASCNSVGRGHPLCAGGDTDVFDACLAKLEEWQADSLRRLSRDAKASTATWKVVNSHYSPHFHMAPPMMQEWNNVLAATGGHLFMNGHMHAESHEYGNFKTHFVTNGTSGGIQSESISGPPDYATNISTVWIGHDTPYGIFELHFGKQQMKLQFVTFDGAWEFKKSSADTIKGGGQVSHCWLIPKDGSKGKSVDF